MGCIFGWTLTHQALSEDDGWGWEHGQAWSKSEWVWFDFNGLGLDKKKVNEFVFWARLLIGLELGFKFWTRQSKWPGPCIVSLCKCLHVMKCVIKADRTLIHQNQDKERIFCFIYYLFLIIISYCLSCLIN